jgi:putative transposase
MLGNGHVRFGRRAAETDQSKDRHRAAARPHSYVPTWSGMVYVAFVIDAYGRRILGWRAATSMTTTLVLDALEHVIFTRASEGITDLAGLICHNDAGSRYTSIAFTSRLIEAGVDPSVGSVG